MSGLVKAKKYDWKDSNLALFGSDTEKKVKKESAQTEPAWKGAGQKRGVQVWRIQKFKVTHWPKEDYGKFYSGDSYIILNTYSKPGENEFLYDVHFWIGQYSSQDEYGTAAYKTVELDILLNDKPVQHREVMNHESDLFKSYFNSIILMEGGCDTGFRHVKPEEYPLRLLHFRKQGRKVILREVDPYLSNLNSGDVFIIDNGLEIFQWNGKTCNKDEKYSAAQSLQQLKGERHGRAKTENLDESRIYETHRIYELLQKGDPPAPDEVDGADDTEAFPPTLLRLSDEDGKLAIILMNEGSIPKDMLSSQDVFIVDVAKEVYVWVGKGASDDEQRNGLTYAHNYLKSTKHPLAPVTVLREGQNNEGFEKTLS